jgi:hypothetical protein
LLAHFACGMIKQGHTPLCAALHLIGPNYEQSIIHCKYNFIYALISYAVTRIFGTSSTRGRFLYFFLFWPKKFRPKTFGRKDFSQKIFDRNENWILVPLILAENFEEKYTRIQFSFWPKILKKNTQESNFHFGQNFHLLFRPKS